MSGSIKFRKFSLKCYLFWLTPLFVGIYASKLSHANQSCAQSASKLSNNAFQYTHDLDQRFLDDNKKVDLEQLRKFGVEKAIETSNISPELRRMLTNSLTRFRAEGGIFAHDRSRGFAAFRQPETAQGNPEILLSPINSEDFFRALKHELDHFRRWQKISHKVAKTSPQNINPQMALARKLENDIIGNINDTEISELSALRSESSYQTGSLRHPETNQEYPLLRSIEVGWKKAHEHALHDHKTVKFHIRHQMLRLAQMRVKQYVANLETQIRRSKTSIVANAEEIDNHFSLTNVELNQFRITSQDFNIFISLKDSHKQIFYNLINTLATAQHKDIVGYSKKELLILKNKLRREAKSE